MKKKPAPRPAPLPATSVPNRLPWILAGLFSAALLIRLIALGRSTLWQDETNFLSIIANPRLSPWGVARQYWEYTLLAMGQMPLSGILQNAWMHMTGGGNASTVMMDAFLMRLPAAFFGSLAIPGFFLLASRLLSKPAAWAATLMMIFFFFPVFYSREVYCYAHVLCFATWGTWLFITTPAQPGRHAWRMIMLCLCMTALGLCHMAGLILTVGMTAAGGCYWLYRLRNPTTEPRTPQLFFTTASCAAAFLLASPFLIRYVSGRPAHLTGQIAIPVFSIINDSVSKFFLGENPAAAIAAWAALLAGGLAFLYPHKQAIERRLVLATTILTIALLAVITHKSQYISARYLSPVAPLCYLLFAQGLETIATAAGRKSPGRARRIFLILAGLVLAAHLAVYLPLLYRMRNKSQDFKSIAGWINQNVQPGNPYLMESAYELRMVGGFHPTPDRVGASPYVHGSGLEEMQRLHAAQREFIMDFPTAPFIESAHHYFGTTNYWTWPRTFFKQQTRLRDEPLRHLARMGIIPMEPYPDINEAMFTTDIYYNRPEDLDTVARENGWPAVFQYPSWRCVALEQTQQGNARYGRMHPGNRGHITVKGSSPLQYGCFQAESAIIAPAGDYSGSLLWNGQPIGTFALQPSRLMAITSRPVDLTDAAGDLQWAATGASAQQVQALAIARLRFIPVPRETPSPAAPGKK